MTGHQYLRALQEEEEGSFEQHGDANFDDILIWLVNGFIFLLLLSTCAWIWCFGGMSHMLAATHQSDQEYAQTVLERRRRREEAKKETPDRRKLKLIRSFQRCQVKMVVKEEDLVPPTTEDALDENIKAAEEALETDVPVDPMLAELEACNAGHLILRADENNPEPKVRQVPNCCAICLGDYEVGETVVWSSNASCMHAFHEECIMDWLTKMQNGTPCPCCRQDFTDLEAYRRECRIRWAPGSTFNPNSIQLR